MRAFRRVAGAELRRLGRGSPNVPAKPLPFACMSRSGRRGRRVALGRRVLDRSPAAASASTPELTLTQTPSCRRDAQRHPGRSAAPGDVCPMADGRPGPGTSTPLCGDYGELQDRLADGLRRLEVGASRPARVPDRHVFERHAHAVDRGRDPAPARAPGRRPAGDTPRL